jgi:hypothetical protein
MGKNLKYGEFDFGEPKTAMKKGGMCEGYAKGGPKKPAKPMKREPEAMVRKEVALLRKAGAPKAVIRHEMTEMAEPKALKNGGATKRMSEGGQAMTEGERKRLMEGASVTKGERASMLGSGNITEGERARMARSPENRAVKESRERFDSRMTEGERARMLKNKNYAKGGSVEAKLEKHANMPVSKAHGPGAGNKLAKGGVPTFSKTPKFGKTK